MLHMLTVSRRDLHHRQGEILDSIKRTGHPVRVRGRDGVSFLVTLEPEEETPYDRLVRQGQLIATTSPPTRMAQLPKYGPDMDLEALLEQISEDH